MLEYIRICFLYVYVTSGDVGNYENRKFIIDMTYIYSHITNINVTN